MKFNALSKMSRRHAPNRGKDKLFYYYSLSIPNELAEKIPEGTKFELTVDDEGLHFKPVSVQVVKKVVEKKTIQTPIKLNLV